MSDDNHLSQGRVGRDQSGLRVTLKPHTVEYLCDSGTGNATGTHYGRISARERLCPCGIALRACQCPLRQAKSTTEIT